MNQKHCTRCKLVLPSSSFTARKDRPGQYQTMCIPCNRAYQKEHYRKNRADYISKAASYKETIKDRIREIKSSTPCVDCGNRYHFSQMDFDHLDEDDKSFALSRSMDHSWRAIEQEMAKCDLLCANCHRLRTFKRTHHL